MKTNAFSLVIGIFLLSAGASVSHAVTPPPTITTSPLPACTSPCGTGATPGVTTVRSDGINGTVYEITGGARPGNGTNLFHSFGLFSVDVGNTANFINDMNLPTMNILSRVTGGRPSNIFGTIQMTGFGSANLFLINPFGVVFGPNASLNIGGSFHVSTADYLKMADGSLFIANSSYEGAATRSGTIATVLSSADPAAFGFLGSNPAPITIQGGTLGSTLAVNPGQSISIIGGDITITGTGNPLGVDPPVLSAPGGQINMVSVASPGEVLLSRLSNLSSLSDFQSTRNVNGDSFTAMGTINISQSSSLDVSGDGGGTVLIRGGQFILNNSTISANTTGPAVGPLIGQPGAGIDIEVAQDVVIQNAAVLETNVSQNVAPGIGSGGIRVKADRIEILGSQDFVNFPFTGIRSEVALGSTGGDSGDIKLEANSILVQDFGTFSTFVDTKTGGTGNAGNIILRAINNLGIDGGAIQSTSSATDFGAGGNPGNIASGNAGNIELTSAHGNILMTNFPFVTSQTYVDSSGNAGNIMVNAPGGDILLTDQGFLFTAIRGTGGTGGSGQIQITANNLHMLNNSVISGDNLTPLPPGSITVTLSGNLSLSGGPFGNSFIQTTSRTTAASADLNITAKNILITDSSFLSTESFRSGSGGNLNIAAESLQVSNGGQIRSGASGSGPGGVINLQVGELSVTAEGSISAVSTSTGNAGNIQITASDSVVLQNSSITAATTQSDGGNITLQVGRLVQLTDSQITTSVQGGLGNGGNITIDPQVVSLQNSQILANAFGGNGGNISIVAGVFLVDPTSMISASSAFGLSGTVEIQATVSNLSESVAPLSGEFRQAAALLPARCAARFNQSSLVLAGRDGVPLEPGGLLPSPLYGASQSIAGPSVSLDVPSLRVGRAWGDSHVTLVALETGCAS